MAACLIDILNGKKFFSDMLTLVLAYVLAIGVVQSSRYIKRFYVRRFANNVNRRMKHTLYGSLVQKSRRTLSEEGAGTCLLYTSCIGKCRILVKIIGCGKPGQQYCKAQSQQLIHTSSVSHTQAPLKPEIQKRIVGIPDKIGHRQ